MKNSLALTLMLVFPSLVLAQIEDVYTDAQAAEMAKALVKDVYAMRKEVNDLCLQPGKAEKLYQSAQKADDKLSEWRDDNLKYRALFPYYACRQSMIDVSSFATTCAVGSYRGEAASYDQRRWKEDTAECEDSIRNPDLTLKEIE